MRVLLYYYY